MGVGEASQNIKLLDAAVDEMTRVTGQKPVTTRAKKAISNFKIRENMPIGCMVTLRGDKMYEFLDRLMNVALPRIRDFRGVPTRSFDGQGNYTLGIKEQIIFPEIEYDKITRTQGLDVCIVTTAASDEQGKALLKHLGMPFRN
jgi:large subunit ribosomal protein L5